MKICGRNASPENEACDPAYGIAAARYKSNTFEGPILD